MKMNKAQEARAMQGQGRAGRGWHTKTKEDLIDQLDKRRFDLRRGFGVETHHAKAAAFPPLQQSSTNAGCEAGRSPPTSPSRLEASDFKRQRLSGTLHQFTPSKLKLPLPEFRPYLTILL
jgi:hypothetical protein